MSDTKFTPGPWKVEKELFAKSHRWVISYDAKDKGRGIAIAVTIGATGKELANARLIAAAPDLYYELEKLIDYLEQERLIPDTDTAKAALSKARGEKQ